MFGLDPAILRQYGITYAGATSPGEQNFDKLPVDQKKAFLDVEIARISRDCLPSGVPGIGGALHGMQMVQTPGQLVELVDGNHDDRFIPSNGQPQAAKTPIRNSMAMSEGIGKATSSWLTPLPSTRGCGTALPGGFIAIRST